MPKFKNKKNGTKRSKFLVALGAVVLSLFLFTFVYYAYDEFTLYWFLLINQDSVSDRRRSEDFSWYSGQSNYNEGGTSANGVPGTSGSSDPNVDTSSPLAPNGIYSPAYSNMEPYQALKSVEATLTDEDTQKSETFFRFLIYYMDQKGYVPNAIIAVIANSEGECSSVSGGILCTWLYQGGHSGGTVAGPDGVQHSTLKDNAAWADWVESRGAQDKGTGLGFYQWSNGRALNLINYADSQGTVWQSPSTQISFFFEVESKERHWNIAKETMPGVDPQSSVDVSVSEWIHRLFADEMGSGYSKYTKYDMTADHGHNEPKRIGAIEEATKIYNQWSRKDPWFYRNTATSTAVNPTFVGSQDWHDPFTGKAYDNSTPQGLLLARIALLMASGDQTMGDSPIQMGGVWGKDAPNLVNCPTLQYYRTALSILEPGTTYYASCDRSVVTCIRLAGVDDNFPWGKTSNIYDYITTNGASKWKRIGTYPLENIQPGDIILSDGGGHIMMYIGENVANERWEGSTATIYSGSYGERYPHIHKPYSDSRTFSVYRSINTEFSSVNWDKFIREKNGMFPELDSAYIAPGTERPLPDDSWYWPLPGYNRISSMFGERVHPITGVYGSHGGYDLPAPEGTPIYAAQDGVVAYSGWEKGFGNYCSIKHDGGYKTYYGHQCQPPLVSTGDTVTKGQLIGYVGTTGTSTGNHLHFELRVNGDKQDVMQFYTGKEMQVKISDGVYEPWIVQ